MPPALRAFHVGRVRRLLADLALEPTALMVVGSLEPGSRGFELVDGLTMRVLLPAVASPSIAEGVASAIKLAAVEAAR